MRGTTNGNDRGSSYTRRRRRAWLVENYASNVEGCCRCYRCGKLLYNPDAEIPVELRAGTAILAMPAGWAGFEPLTVDRIIPGCQGGTYRRNNIRPACAACNSETGGAVRRGGKVA